MSTSLIPEPPPFSRKLAACLSYGAVSVSITLFNKAVFTVYHFPYPCTVTALQIFVSLLYMVVLQRFRAFDWGRLSFSKAKQAGPVPMTSLALHHCESDVNLTAGAGCTIGDPVVAVCRLWLVCAAPPQRANVQVMDSLSLASCRAKAS